MKSSFKKCYTGSYDLNIKKEGDILNTNKIKLKLWKLGKYISKIIVN